MLKPAIAGALALACLASPAWAQTHTDTNGTVVQGTFDVSNATHTPLYCQITVTTTATSLKSLLATATTVNGNGCSSTLPTWATVVYLTPESSSTVAIRWAADGTTISATLGEPVFGNTKDPCLLGYNAINNASLISATGANVTVDVRIGG